MIMLSDLQKDAFIEIYNVGMSRAAKQLSVLLNSHIHITIPNILIENIENFFSVSTFHSDQTLAYVCQALKGEIDGRALLIFYREQTSLLTRLVIGKMPKLSEKAIRAYQQEAILEIGNIIITSCLSAMMNTFNETVALSVPMYGESHIHTLIEEQIELLKRNMKDVIIIFTRLETITEGMSGSLMLFITRDCMNKLLQAVVTLAGETIS